MSVAFQKINAEVVDKGINKKQTFVLIENNWDDPEAIDGKMNYDLKCQHI